MARRFGVIVLIVSSVSYIRIKRFRYFFEQQGPLNCSSRWPDLLLDFDVRMLYHCDKVNAEIGILICRILIYRCLTFERCYALEIYSINERST